MAAFQAETFEDLHKVVAQLASGNDSSEAEAFVELRQCKEALSKPFTFRSREDTMDLPSLARSIMAERPRLATEHLVKLVDEVSRVLRLHQSDCCTLVERALSLGVALQEVPRKCAAIFYRECHFQALCLHDMGQGLAQNPPRKSSLAFFGLLGGRRCIASLFEALGLLLRDLTGERAGDQVFLVHAGTMIQLLVETLLAYFTTFQATVEEAEQVLSLLPHVVTSQHAPIGQGFTVSDLDLVLREEHNDVSIKLCLVLVCMCHSQASGDAKLAPAKLREDVLPSQIRLQDLAAEAGSLLLGPFGQKLRAGNYWNEESQLGQFLCFAISGVLLEDDHALRGGYVRWHFFHFLLHEVLMSAVAVPDTCTGLLVLRCVSELLQRALLPVGRRWTAVKKLEAQAVQMRLLTPDNLQISALQVLNRLCRLHPPACEIFRDVALQCTDSFHLTHRQMEGFSPWSTAVPEQVRSWAVSPFAAPAMQATAPRHDNTMLYAEILDLVATICARGSLQTASLVCQKLLSHSNQWFNWSFLLDTLLQHARVPPSTGGGPGPSAGDAMVMALCRLVSGACGGRLLVMQPTMQPIANSLNSGVASSLGDPWGRAENLAGILVDVLSAHPEPAVKAACLGALGNLDLPPPQVSRNIISSILMAVPSLVPFVEHPRVCDGAVAIELLACVIRFLQAIPISKGRYGLDLQPLTHVVIHQVLLKALAEPSAFRSSSRYWRLAALTLRWLRLVLRGPLPMSTSSSLNALIVRPYSDSDSTAAEVSMRCAAGNATAYAFRCLLSLDSPVFARVLYLTTLQGHAMDGLTNGRRAGASQAYLEQCARHGLDVVRILLQRDVLFSRLHAQNTSERALSSMWSGAAFLQDGPILPTHRLLLTEFAFTYPPGGSGRSSSFSAFNPFWSQRPHFEQTESPDASAGSRRHNPSYLALLSEFVGVRSHNGIGRLALFVFMQCSYREPQRVLRLLQLEPWRLVALSAALYDRIVEPDEGEACKEALTAAKSQGKTWDKSTEAYFMHEAMEIDASPDFCHLDVTSFETALPLCRAVDLLQQLAEDSVVQAADISVWARGSSAEGSDAGASSLRGCASSDASLFRAAYLRGFDIPAHWLSHGATSLMAVIQNENTVQLPFAALAAESSRSLTLRFFLLLLGDTTTDSSAPSQSLAQLLLGLDPNGESSGFVDIDQTRAGNPSALDALMLLLENPPSLPAWIDSGAPRSSSRALQPRSATQPEIQEAIRNHSAYEASLSVVLSLLAMPALRDVVLRYMCHAWTSRYRVLKSLLAVSWSSLATSLQRILLSEAALILQVCAWEMRLVWPSGRPPMEHLDTTADILGQQRLDMKMNVSEHLQEVVCDLISHSDSGLSGHTSMPYLVNAALRLADACDVVDKVVGSAALQGSDSVLFGRDAMQDQLRASTCQCMAPAKAGGALSRKLELQDPHLLLHLSGLSYLLSATEAEGDRSRFAADLQLLCSRNEYACIAYYTECACSGLTTFVSAALSHLVGRPRAMIGSTESDSRAQAARAHLEALLPAMAAEEAGAEAPRRLELLSGLATAFLAAMIERSKAPPLAFVRRVYVLLSGALVRPLAVSRESRRNLQEALLVLLQRMLPDQALDVAMGFQLPDLEAEDATELARLVSSLMAAEMAEAEHVAESDPSSNGPGVSLPLLCGLMTRVPARQLSTVFSGLWRQLTELIQAGSQASLRDTNCLRHLHGSALAAILCQSPESASAFFEAGGLSAVLRPEMLQGRMRLAPAGLHALDTVHPAALVSVLQVLVAMIGVLPTHNLVLQSALQWLERHLQPLLDVMQWVTRLPFTTSSEPRARAVGGASPSSVVAALAARTGRSAGREGPDAMLVVCRSPQNPQTSASTTRDLCVDGLAFWLSGRCSMSSGSSVGADDKYADGIALCHRCLALFVELWSLVHVSVARRRKYAAGKADVYQAQLEKLEPMIHAALPGLLMQVASASAPDPDSMSDADGSAGNAMLLEALRPSEVTQHRIISNILQIWRYDSITQHIKMLATKHPQAQPSAQSAWSLWQQVQQTGPFQQVTHGTGMSQSIVGEVKVRSGVLCAVFVHACCKFLSLRLSDPLPVCTEGDTLASLEATVDGQGGHGEQLHFDGVPATFTQLLYVVEISLHLLCLHLMLLTTVADLDGAPTVSTQTPPTPGPRLAIVGQYLRLLIEFAAASGGSVALVARCPKTCDLPCTVSNLAFAASAASAAEKLVAQMQLQQGGL